MQSEQVHQFQQLVRAYYHVHGRKLPWRLTEPDGSFNVYKILVSEIMLQQTQVNRVVPMYMAFLQRFPSLSSLAKSSLADVLIAWSGLGYNRRAKYLHDAAKQLVSRPQPWGLEALTICKGIGDNTAAAVIVYAYDEPLLLVETNIRSVYIHHFFEGRDGIRDTEILDMLRLTLDRDHPREFYWALMDYGTHLKATAGNSARRSIHYARQSNFKSSLRELRGQIIRELSSDQMTMEQLRACWSDERIAEVLLSLLNEGLIIKSGSFYSLPS